MTALKLEKKSWFDYITCISVHLPSNLTRNVSPRFLWKLNAEYCALSSSHFVAKKKQTCFPRNTIRKISISLGLCDFLLIFLILSYLLIFPPYLFFEKSRHRNDFCFIYLPRNTEHDTAYHHKYLARRILADIPLFLHCACNLIPSYHDASGIIHFTSCN